MAELPPRLIEALRDHYRLERELGRGGMGAVYLAEDLKHHRRVAVKVLRPDLSASLGTDRFLREIEVAARLQHPPSSRSTTAARPTATSSTSCLMWKASRCATGWPASTS